MTRSIRSVADPAHPERDQAERDQAGAGLIATVAGVTVFLVLMLFAVQVLVGLYATSVVTAATYDAAKVLAGADTGDSAVARANAESGARSQLGRYGEKAVFGWENDAQVVRLHVQAPRPTLLPRSLVRGVGVSEIERTVTVRVERVQ
jgi:Flp pilus assembly protein TadG